MSAYQDDFRDCWRRQCALAMPAECKSLLVARCLQSLISSGEGCSKDRIEPRGIVRAFQAGLIFHVQTNLVNTNVYNGKEGTHCIGCCTIDRIGRGAVLDSPKSLGAYGGLYDLRLRLSRRIVANS